MNDPAVKSPCPNQTRIQAEAGGLHEPSLSDGFEHLLRLDPDASLQRFRDACSLLDQLLAAPRTASSRQEAEVSPQDARPKYSQVSPPGPAAPVSILESSAAKPVARADRLPTEAAKQPNVKPKPKSADTRPAISAEKAKKSEIHTAQPFRFQAISEIGKRIEERLEVLRQRILPQVVTLSVAPNMVDSFALIQRYCDAFNACFARQIGNVHAAVEEIEKLGLDKPHPEPLFKTKQEQSLCLLDSLANGLHTIETMASDSSAYACDSSLSAEIRERMKSSEGMIHEIRRDLHVARRLIATASRVTEVPLSKKAVPDRPSAGITGKSEIGQPVYPHVGSQLLSSCEAGLKKRAEEVLNGIDSDEKRKRVLGDVLSNFIQSVIQSYGEIRDAVYQERRNGLSLTDMQKERVRYMAEELAIEMDASHLISFSRTFCAIPKSEQKYLTRLLDGSMFDREFKEVRKAFAAELLKEIEVAA